MTTDGSVRIMTRLRALFPTLAGNTDHQAHLAREMDKADFSEQQVGRAIDDYLTLGEKFLNPSQLMAIAYRISRQEQERADAAAKAVARANEIGRRDEHKTALERAADIIADMTDEDVQREWAPILVMMTGKAREWAEKWPMEKVRTNIPFKLRIAELAGAR